MQKAPAYVTICLVFLLLIGIGFAYSYFFYPNAHPIGCVIKSYTGKDCATCGFSKAFSYYAHLQFKQGISINELSWPVFLFFTFQFLIRATVVLYYFAVHKSPQRSFIVLDIVISISLFLLAFLPIIHKSL